MFCFLQVKLVANESVTVVAPSHIVVKPAVVKLMSTFERLAFAGYADGSALYTPLDSKHQPVSYTPPTLPTNCAV